MFESVNNGPTVIECAGVDKYKTFIIKMKDGVQEEGEVIRFAKGEYKDIFSKISRWAKIKEQHLCFYYALGLLGGGERLVCVKHCQPGDLLQEKLELFYIQAVPLSEILVENVKTPNRRKKTVETVYTEFTSFKDINIESYKVLKDRPHIAKT